MQKRGVDVVEIIGTDATHARRLLDAALGRGTDAVVVAGGDGVIGLALQALAGNDIPLGIVPAGTGNDHAREYGIPRIRRVPRTSSPTAGRKPLTWARSATTRAPPPGSARSRQRASIHWSPTGPTGCAGRADGCATTWRCLPSCRGCGCCRFGWCSTASARSSPTSRWRRSAIPAATAAACASARRRPRRRPARYHDGALGVAKPVGPLVSHRVQRNPCRVGRGEHGARSLR
ncbi:diacylglycerol kinase [Mycobacterium xenopi 4042]|uniref:Diacylglycerol kinase n=1 Tax=Mycobacterium xenopi 4042 TaxID=1299334 RepID=X8DD37_MYCXE|nr:diacylglycerol kinase [Mycobacterium xenopi 4042]